MAINFRAKGDMIIMRKVNPKAAQECYAQSLKVANTWLGSVSMTIPTGPTLLGYYLRNVTSS